MKIKSIPFIIYVLGGIASLPGSTLADNLILSLPDQLASKEKAPESFMDRTAPIKKEEKSNSLSNQPFAPKRDIIMKTVKGDPNSLTPLEAHRERSQRIGAIPKL